MLAEIKKLKKKLNALLLVHNYQRPEIQDIADFCGDSLGLSRKAASAASDMIVFCGVKFMAETAKILSPQKTVLLPRPDAGCPMANMADAAALTDLKKKHPQAKVVTYVNSTAEVKALSDVCCTSANAVSVVKNIKADEIIFAPDQNLATYCQRFTEKKIIPWNGHCYVHRRFRPEEVKKARSKQPQAELLVHPECDPEVIDLADRVLSTSGMLRYAKESTKKIFLIGTEEGLIYRLQKENPQKTFYSAGSPKVCLNMKKISLRDLYDALKYQQYKITVPEATRKRAAGALEQMLKYG